MAIFGFYATENKELKEFLDKLNSKLSEPNLLTNPFKGHLKLIKQDKDFVFVFMDLIWFNPIYFAIILTGVLLISVGLHWSLILTLPLWLVSIFFTKQFLILSLRRELKKINYKGTFEVMNDTDLLLRLSDWESSK